jgi:hypothetical protein
MKSVYSEVRTGSLNKAGCASSLKGLYFHLIVVFSTYFEHPSVHPQEGLYMQFYDNSSCIHINSLFDGRTTLPALTEILEDAIFTVEKLKKHNFWNC